MKLPLFTIELARLIIFIIVVVLILKFLHDIISDIDGHGHQHHSFSDKKQLYDASIHPHIQPGRMEPIMDPRFCIRECIKNCLLLEDHLNSETRLCIDCVCKHTYLIEAFAEEAISLKSDKYADFDCEDAQHISRSIKQIQKELFGDATIGKPPISKTRRIAQEVRRLRKPYMRKYVAYS